MDLRRLFGRDLILRTVGGSASSKMGVLEGEGSCEYILVEAAWPRSSSCAVRAWTPSRMGIGGEAEEAEVVSHLASIWFGKETMRNETDGGRTTNLD